MKVIMCSRTFPKRHPKAGQKTYFVEKIWAALSPAFFPDEKLIKNLNFYDWLEYDSCALPKHHTIRSGSRWKPGDWASLRIWSDKPYRSKQIEFAQVEVKKAWEIKIRIEDNQMIVGVKTNMTEITGFVYLLPTCEVAKNDGLDCQDFFDWFNMHPKKKHNDFNGQIICWSESLTYPIPPLTSTTHP